MNDLGPRFLEIFFEVYESLPRQGPGNRACAVRALGLCREIAECPAILDLGCGVGGQTLHLAEMTSDTIVAIDSHPPSILRRRWSRFGGTCLLEMWTTQKFRQLPGLE